MNNQVVDGIRQYYQLPNEITDEQIIKELRGSLGETIVNLNISQKNLIKAFGEAMPRIKKIFQRYTL